MGESKLSSGTSYFAFSLIGLIAGLSLYAQSGTAELKTAVMSQIAFIIGSGCASLIGLLWMFRFIRDTPQDKRGDLIIAMIVAQIVVTKIAASIAAKTPPTGRQIVGMGLAAATVFILQK
jgi:dolichol kinase